MCIVRKQVLYNAQNRSSTLRTRTARKVAKRERQDRRFSISGEGAARPERVMMLSAG
jgi:hypothetical protein